MPNPAAFLEVPLEVVMTPSPATVGPEDSLEEAAGLMLQGGFRHLPVVDVDGRLVGMLAERDLRARLGVEIERFPDAARDLLAGEVQDAMRPDPITIPRSASVRDALEILLDERVGALPVLEDGERLVGILSYLDLLAHVRREAPSGTPERTRPAATRRRRKRPASRASGTGGARRAPPRRQAARRAKRRGGR